MILSWTPSRRNCSHRADKPHQHQEPGAIERAVRFAAGLAFLLMGAWPVLGFFGLDVLVIYWAFRINFRDAKAIEEISMTPFELRVRRVSHRGHVVEWVLNPLWVRLDQI